MSARPASLERYGPVSKSLPQNPRSELCLRCERLLERVATATKSVSCLILANYSSNPQPERAGPTFAYSQAERFLRRRRRYRGGTFPS